MLRTVIVLVALLSAAATARAQLLRERLTGGPYGQFGSSVATIGDVDGDGIEDFAIGEPNYSLSSASHEGRLSIHRGSDGTLIRTIVGAKGDGLGGCVAGAGDVDGDGVADLVAGAPGHSSSNYLEEGLAAVYSGSSGAVVWSIHGNNDFEWVGASVSGAADFNGDGRPEVLVGTAFDYMVVVEHTGNRLRTLRGGLLFGYRVMGIGDVDLDGVADFVVSESWYDPGPLKPRRGRVHVCSGATGVLLYSVVGDADNDYLGRTLARLDDVDGDAIPDFIAASYVSSQGGNQAGLVRVLSGKDGSTLVKLLGSGASKWFGFAVAGSSDLDGDGIPDYAVGIPGVPTTGSNGGGEVQLLSGADGSVLYDLVGQNVGTGSNVALGMAVASGDLNLDAIPDFICGDPVFDDPTLGGPVGAVEVYLGCPASSGNYGTGWPGTIGVPSLTASADPGLGSTLSLNVGNSLGAATSGLLAVGFLSTSIPLPSGATLLVVPTLFVPLAVPAGGEVVTGSIPNDPKLCFTQLFAQAIEFDPGAIGLLSLTAGLELSIGFDL